MSTATSAPPTRPATGATTARERERAPISARLTRRRMIVVVNPYATTVSDRLKNLVLYALQGRYAVEAVDTERRAHATQICREAPSEGYDVVVAFGGDRTVNEAANGLIGSDTPLTCLPGGATNALRRRSSHAARSRPASRSALEPNAPGSSRSARRRSSRKRPSSPACARRTSIARA